MSDHDDLDGLWDSVADDNGEAIERKPRPRAGEGATAAPLASVPPPAMPELDDAWGSPAPPAALPKPARTTHPKPGRASQDKPTSPKAAIAARPQQAPVRPAARRSPAPLPSNTAFGATSARKTDATHAAATKPASAAPKLSKRAKRALKRGAQVHGKKARKRAKQARRAQRQQERKSATAETTARSQEARELRKPASEDTPRKAKPARKTKAKQAPSRVTPSKRKARAKPVTQEEDYELTPVPEPPKRRTDRASLKALLAFVAVGVVVALVAVLAGSK